MYNVRLVIPSDSSEDEEWEFPQLVAASPMYEKSGEASDDFHAWRERLVTASCNGLLAIRETPGKLVLELVDYTDRVTGTDIDTSTDTYNPAWHGWVMGVHVIWQRFTPDTEPDPWLPEYTELVTHEVKPVWCDGCDAWHVECEFGCCAIEV